MHGPFTWILAVAATLSQTTAAAAPQFVGVTVCAQCHDAVAHGEAMTTWQASPHANAYRTLAQSTEPAPRECGDLRLWIVRMSHGERYGLPTPASEAKECLPCHSTGFGAAAERLAASFDRSAGVQCESCHGPGSAHVEAVRAGGDAPITAGLTAYADERAIQRRCATCHDGTCGTLDFAAMWPKVRHAAPRDR